MNYVFKILYSILILFFLNSCAGIDTHYDQRKIIKNTTNLSEMTDYNLCYVSVNPFSLKHGTKTMMWIPKAKRGSPHVIEAKRRGLTCGVSTLNKQISTRKISSWTDKELCDYNKLHFSKPNKYSKAIRYILDVVQIEESRRNINCALNNKSLIIASQSKLRVTEKTKSNTSSRELKKNKQKRKELERNLAALENKQKKEQQQFKPKTIVKTEPKSEFSNKPLNINFKSITKRTDDIAVIIGNANYKKQGKDISNVNPAYADAEGIKQYFMQAKGIKEGNIIFLKDATAAQLLGTFGDSNSHKGQLYNWVKPQVSNVYVYYSGHGMPGGEKGNAYLVPTNADSQTIQFSGYALETLYSNLGKLSAKSITVILEACFSGQSQAGSLFNKSSPVIITPKKTMIPKNVKVISAGAVDQMASWEQDNSHGLFTKYFLKAMSGEGDKNNDGKVSDSELKNYLGETMTYYARRYYGRDQNVQIMQGN